MGEDRESLLYKQMFHRRTREFRNGPKLIHAWPVAQARTRGFLPASNNQPFGQRVPFRELTRISRIHTHADHTAGLSAFSLQMQCLLQFEGPVSKSITMLSRRRRLPVFGESGSHRSHLKSGVCKQEVRRLIDWNGGSKFVKGVGILYAAPGVLKSY